MERKKLFVVLYVVGFIISGISFTMLMLSVSHDWISMTLAVGMAIIFKFGEGIAFLNVFNKKLNATVRYALLSIWFVLLVSSIFSSQSRLVNETNKSENESKLNSSAYHATLKQQDNNKQIVELKKKEISDLEKLRDSYPRNYIDRKKEIQAKIDVKNKELEASIVTLNQSLNIDGMKFEPDSVDGYTATLKVIAKWTASDTDTVKFWFFFILTVIFELLICLLYYLSTLNFETQLASNEPRKATLSPTLNATLKPIATYNLKKSPVKEPLKGTLTEITVEPPKPKSISSEKLNRFVSVMNETRTPEGMIRGYQYISKRAGLTDHEGKKCIGALEEQGRIQAKDGRYFTI